MRGLFIAAFLMAFLPTLNAQLPAPAAGACSFIWTEEPDHFSIWAEDASLPGIIRDVGHLHGADIATGTTDDDVRTFRYLQVTLEEFLDRLNISYTLHYTRSDAGDITLLGGQAGHGRHPAGYTLPPLPTGPIADQVQALLANLKDDDIRWNYEDAMQELYRFEHPEIAIPFLERLLINGDFQEKQGAYYLLSSYGSAWQDTPAYANPSPTFMAIKVNALKDDYLDERYDEPNRLSTRATSTLNYFHSNPQHVVRSEPALNQALYQTDRQYRFLSAAILGGAGRRSQASRIVDILAPQLMDNDTERDSKLAVYGLSGLGPAAAPYLENYEGRADEQARGLLKQIRDNWGNADWKASYNYLHTAYWDQSSFARLPGDPEVPARD